MTSPSPASAAVTRVIDAHMAANQAIRTRLAAFVTTLWGGLSSWRSGDMETFVARIVPMVLASQRQAAALTDAYLGQLAATVLGAGRPVGVPANEVSGRALRGVPPEEVYERPFKTVWTALANGHTLDAAVAEGRTRLLSLAMTDLQLARTHTARAEFAQDRRVVGHRRVLSGSENCGICLVASTQRYRKSQLQPIHPGCDCGVEPIYGSRDPGQVIDPETLEATHAAIEERFGTSDRGGRDPIDYRKVLIVREHGELGPVLTVKGQHFTGPNDLA